MRVLVTGGAGFVAGHLIEYLSGLPGMEIYATRRPGSDKRVKGEKEGRTNVLDCDLLDGAAVQRLIEAARPERIFHLAAQSSVSDSWLKPEDTIRANVLPAIHLFEALKKAAPGASALTAGSAQEYAPAAGPGELPLGEDHKLAPNSPYGVGKAAQDLASCQYGIQGLKIVRVRSFNVVGPGQDRRFAASDFARQTALIEAGRQEPVIRTGNLDAVRDFTDVRDMARALHLALDRGEPGEAYNICTGRGRAIREILDCFRAKSRVKFETTTDPDKMRPADVPALVGDPQKFMKRTGWAPTRSFEETLGALLEDWRKKIADQDV